MAYSAFFWWAVALVIIGILLLLAAAIWFAAIRRAEWYIWLLVGLGALLLIVGIILFIYDYSRTPMDLMPNTGCGTTVRTVAAPVVATTGTTAVQAACPPGGCYTQYAPPSSTTYSPAGTVAPQAQQYQAPQYQAQQYQAQQPQAQQYQAAQGQGQQVLHTVSHQVGHAVV